MLVVAVSAGDGGQAARARPTRPGRAGGSSRIKLDTTFRLVHDRRNRSTGESRAIETAAGNAMLVGQG